MILLIKLADGMLAQRIVDALHDAGINAKAGTTQTVAELYVGGTPMTEIWIENTADRQRALEITQEIRAAHAETRAAKAKCAKCGYDMRGHRGDTTCPECGAAITTGNVDCPTCGEVVPEHFEVCWNCGGDL